MEALSSYKIIYSGLAPPDVPFVIPAERIMVVILLDTDLASPFLGHIRKIDEIVVQDSPDAEHCGEQATEVAVLSPFRRTGLTGVFPGPIRRFAHEPGEFVQFATVK